MPGQLQDWEKLSQTLDVPQLQFCWKATFPGEVGNSHPVDLATIAHLAELQETPLLDEDPHAPTGHLQDATQFHPRGGLLIQVQNESVAEVSSVQPLKLHTAFAFM